MEKFIVTKNILANGRRWDKLISGSYSGIQSNSFGRHDPENFFVRESVRDAWMYLEKSFCVSSVSNLIDQISKYYGDCEDRIEYTQYPDGSVTARYFPKNVSKETMEAYGIPDGITVKYTSEGDLEEPEVYSLDCLDSNN